MKKTMMKLLSVVMALMMLFGTFGTLVSANAHEHDKTTFVETIGPRCNAYGYTLYVCSCGETWAGDIVDKTEGKHSLEVDGTFTAVDAKAPTCTEDGKAAGKLCAWCGVELEGCEKTADKLGHNMQYVIEDGTCNEVEKIVYKCINEGCNEDDGYLPLDFDCSINKDGHNFVYKITKYPSCVLVADTAGDAFRVATNGAKIEGYKVKSTNGEATYECVDCGEKYTGIIVEWNCHAPANLVHKTNGLDDTCDDFYAEWDECLICGYATNYRSVDNPSEHHYVQATLAQALKLGYQTNYRVATCYQTGVEVLVCDNVVDGKVCGDVHVNITEKIDHVLSYKCDVDAVCTDCTHEGRVHVCSNYGENKCTYSIEVQKAEHTWSTTKYYKLNGVEKTYAGEKYCKAFALYSKCTNPECAAVNNNEGYTVIDTDNGIHVELYIVEQTGSAVTYKGATCTEDGFIIVNCNYCVNAHQTLEGAAADAFAATYESIDPVVGAIVKNMKFTKLGHMANLEQGKADSATIVSGKEPKEATCVAKGYTGDYVCGRGCGYVVQEGEDIEIDADNHKNLQQVGDTITATCVTPQAKYEECQDCKAIVYTPAEKNSFYHARHTIDPDTYEILGTAVGEVINHAPIAVKCGEEDGQYAYQTCAFCGVIVAIDKDGDTVFDDDGNYVSGTFEVKQTPADVFTDADNDGVWDSGETLTTDHDGDGAYDAAITFTDADLVIAKAHTFPEKDAKPETCTDEGYEAYQEDCTRCGAPSPLSKKVIPAHGDKYRVTIDAADAYASTCTKPGVKAGSWCGKCGSVKFNVEDFDIKNPVATQPWYVAPLGHGITLSHMVKLTQTELDKVMIHKGDCRPESYDAVYYCTYCVWDVDYDENTEILLGTCDEPGKAVAPGAWVIQGLINGYDHTFPEAIFEDDDEAGIVANVTKHVGDCTTATTYTVECEDCSATKVVKEEAAKGHYYVKDGEEVIIDTACTAIEEFAGWTCAGCDKAVGTEILATHNVVEVIEYPGCEDDDEGRHFFACEDCDAVYFDGLDGTVPSGVITDVAAIAAGLLEMIPATGHEFLGFKRDAEGNLAGFKLPTLTEEGYITRVCAKCGDVVTEIDKLEPTLDIVVDAYGEEVEDLIDRDGYVDVVASGDTFYADVTYSGAFYEFNALELVLWYDSDLLEFVEEELTDLPAGVVVKTSGEDKLVLAIYSLDGVALGEEDEESITIAFKALVDFDYTAFGVIEATAFDAKGNVIDDDTDYIDIDMAYDVVSAVVTGELNGFDGINAGDAIVMMDLIYSEEYTSAADLNKDGAVDILDFALLNKLIATDGSAAAYKKLLGYARSY